MESNFGLRQRWYRTISLVVGLCTTPSLLLAADSSEPSSADRASTGLALANPLASAQPTSPLSSGTKIHPLVEDLWRDQGGSDPIKVWVFFKDKGIAAGGTLDRAIGEVQRAYSPRAVERRGHRRTRPGLFDADDLPVNPVYIDSVERTGATMRIASRWLNAISVRATREQMDAIEQLPFVRLIQPVGRGKRVEPGDGGPTRVEPDSRGLTSSRTLDYGLSGPQFDQINLIPVHDMGYTGAGVVIGVLDGGFVKDHIAFNHPEKPLTVLAEWDFVNNDPNVGREPGDWPTQHRHGTRIVGVMGAYAPGEYIGGAFDASFILCKTEDDAAEYPEEEDNWVAGLEFIEANGGDIATSSLAYHAWFTPSDFDGLTAVASIAVNSASANGLLCLNCAGNAGNDADPGSCHLGVPADAFDVLACGAVDLGGTIAGFSSDGPTTDGRVKPEVLALGVNTLSVDPDISTAYAAASGTSLSTPVIAGAAACIIQARPTWTIDQIRTYLFRTASDFVANGTYDPLFVRGYGIINVLAALEGDCNDNEVDDAEDIAMETSLDCNENGVPDECDVDAAGDSRDCNANDIPDECDVVAGFSVDADGDGVPDECCTPDAPIADTLGAKVRFLSFTGGRSDVLQAIRVTLVSLPAPFNTLNGQQMWVAPPDIVTENAGRVSPAGLPGWPTFLASTLQCDPFYTYWGQHGTVHVYHQAIVPRGTYQLEAITVGCSEETASNFSAPLPVSTSVWGDLVRDCSTNPCGPPNGSVDVTTDVTAVLDKFKNLPAAPTKARCDLEPGIPDLLINISDVTYCLDAFRGFAYPFNTVPAPCP